VKPQYRLLRLGVFGCICLVLSSVTPSINAQQIVSAQARKDKAWYIIVALDTSFVPDDRAKQKANYTVTDLQAMRSMTVKDVVIDSDDTIKLVLDDGEQLVPLSKYHLDIATLTFPGINDEDVSPLEKRVTFPDYKKGTSGQVVSAPKSGKRWKSGDAEDRDASNVYASVSITKSRTKAAVKSVDILIDTPVVLNTKPIQRIGPLFELQIGDPQDKGDPDSVKAGASWKFPIQPESLNDFPIIGFQERNDFFIESDRRLDNVNFIWSNRFTLVSKTYYTKKSKFRFAIPLGNELGVNLTSPIATAKHRLIERPFVGAYASLIFPLNKPWMNRIGVEIDYIRRFPLRKELTFDEDDNHDLIVKSFGTNPREYVKSKLNFDLNKPFGISLGYEYGRKPPLYKLVDSKFSIGFTYKIKLERK
jgi:hypothetical protein